MRALLFISATLCAAAPAMAHDYEATPAYGVVFLASDFDDPKVTSITAPAGELNAPCGHSVRATPDIRIQYAGGAPLIVSAAASSDTSLLVHAPDGEWYCDDDGGLEGANPALHFDGVAGAYTIWIGGGAGLPVELTVSRSSSR